MTVLRATLSILCIGVIVYGILDVLTNVENNKCYMTYMFQMPEYIRVPLGKKISKEFPRYGLYLYGEGQYADQIKNFKLSGIPVLFIPGNAGSYKQVRSLGSVALRKSEDERKPFHFNYFSVDLNEELSGFGSFLTEQTDFVHKCLQKIMSLYKQSKHPPKSVILVGHSMGGMIARALFTLPDFDQQLVNTIITQATPHQGPVIALDRQMSQFYDNINGYWRKHSNTALKHVTVISTGGGYRDKLVRHAFTSLKGIVDPELSVSTLTMSVPNAWVSTDHLCAVWCKQMVMTTKRAMFDIIDPNTHQVIEDTGYRMAVFRHHFLSHSGPKQYDNSWTEEIVLDPKVEWSVKEEKLWEFARSKIKSNRYIAVPIQQDKVDSFVAISNVNTRDWICVCKLQSGEKQCSKCINLSKKGETIPPLQSRRKVIHLKLQEIKDMTHIVLIVPKTDLKVEVMGDIYERDRRHLAYSLPGYVDLMMTFPESVYKGATVLTLFNDTLYYNLHLHNFDSLLKAYTVSLEPKRCYHSDLHEGVMMKFHVPWGNEDTYSFNLLNETGNLSLKLQSGLSTDAFNDDIQLEVYLDPSCTYLLRIVAAPLQVLGQLVRFYGLMLPTFMVAVLFMVVIHQLAVMSAETRCPSVLESLEANGQPFKVVPLVVILRLLFQVPAVANLITKFGLSDDGFWMIDQGIYFRFLPLLLFLLASGVVSFHCFIVEKGVIMLSTTVGFIFGWCPISIQTIGQKVQMICLCIALFTSVVFCGTLGLVLCYIICFIKVLRLSYIWRDSQNDYDKSKFNYFMMLLFLWMWTLIFNIVPGFIWIKNLHFSLRLSDDPSRILSIVAILALGTIMICDNPSSGRKSYLAVSWSVLGLNILMMLYGMTSIYRVPYFIVTVIIAMAIPQMIHRIQNRYSLDQKLS